MSTDYFHFQRRKERPGLMRQGVRGEVAQEFFGHTAPAVGVRRGMEVRQGEGLAAVGRARPYFPRGSPGEGGDERLVRRESAPQGHRRLRQRKGADV